MFVRLGSDNAVHRPHGDSVMSSAGGEIADAEKLDGSRVCYVTIPDGNTLLDVFQDITKPAGIWHAQTETSFDEDGKIIAAPPTWVETDMPGLAELLKAQWPSLVIGEPDDVEQTHHTDAGPPGVGPDGPIAGTPLGDELIAAEKAHEDSEAMLAEKPPRGGQGLPSVGRGFGGMLLLMIALAFFALSRVALRVDAGKDFQSKVMGDTASNATGAYASATYIALTENTGAPAAGDTTVTGELSGSGLGRAQATYAHTAGAASYTETKTFTSSDVTTRTIHKAGLLNASSAGTLVFETVLPADAIISSGDTLTITWTVSI